MVFYSFLSNSLRLNLISETTAQSIFTTMAFLAIYPEMQESVFTEIKTQLQDREPVSFLQSDI